MAPRADERVCVGRIGAPHGIRGEVRLQSFTGEPDAIAGYGPLESRDGKLSLEIESLRASGKGLVARFKQIADRNAAERLRNVELYVPRDRLPPPAADEYYYADLVGLIATSGDGVELATVVAVHDFGAGDVLELRPRSGGATVMLPFTDMVVPQVDVPAGRIVIDPPPGTFPSEGGAPGKE